MNLFQISQSLNIFKTPVEQFVELFEILHHFNCLREKGLIEQKEFTFSLC